ncbi:MAG: hypothetical protein IJH43_07340 [Mogibacterium sp.]|nr:hypothetical protein [Mogibacterium sp.]
MPLIILGLLFLIGVLAYSIVRYINSGEEEDHRSVRERYPHIFGSKENVDGPQDVDGDSDEPIHAKGFVDSDSLRGDLDYVLRNIKDAVSEKAKEHGIDLSKLGRNDHDNDDDDGGDDGGGGKEEATIIFPTDNVEAEKNKRNIH